MAAVPCSSSLAIVTPRRSLFQAGRRVSSGFSVCKRYIAVKLNICRRRRSFLPVFRSRKEGVICCTSMQDAVPVVEPREYTAMRIHYHRKDHKYENWGLHVWGDVHVHTSWETPLFGTGFDDHGIYWDIQVKLDGVLHFIVHKGDTKDCSGSVSVSHANIWVVSERSTLFMEKPDLASLRKGDLSLARAYWVNKSLLAWNLNIEHAQFYLFASKNANLNLTLMELL